jgi:hypothetical protein
MTSYAARGRRCRCLSVEPLAPTTRAGLAPHKQFSLVTIRGNRRRSGWVGSFH